MRKVTILLSMGLLIGMGLGIMVSQIQYHKEDELRIKKIVDLEEIIKGQEEELRQLQTKLDEQQADIKRLQTKLGEQQEEMRQLETGIS
jgi:peptidoglycan hydrolase CwlO-like protein